MSKSDLTNHAEFLLTRPEWGATKNSAPRFAERSFLLTRPEWGATKNDVAKTRAVRISTHAPRVGRNCMPGMCRPKPQKFLLTRPEWGATAKLCLGVILVAISTHAPRVGRNETAIYMSSVRVISTHAPRVGRNLAVLAVFDYCCISTHAPRVGRNNKHNRFFRYSFDFYSRAPSGAQLMCRTQAFRAQRFLLTRPEWGATQCNQEGNLE